MADYDSQDADDARAAKGGDVEAFLRVARKRFKTSADAEMGLRAKMLADKRFYSGEHWHPRQKSEREEQDLPCLTIDRLKQPKRQITNGLMAARPGIQISPVDSGADVPTAQAIQGLVRNIERQSHAEVVYATGVDDAVVMGRGFWRINTPWAFDDQPDPNDPEAYFRQEIKLFRVRNAFTVYPDPRAQEIDYRDARYYFVIEDVPIDEYRERYPDSKACSQAPWQSIGDELPEWINERSIRIAEYWYVETTPAVMALLKVPSLPDPETGQARPPTLIVMEKVKGRPWPAGVEEVDTRDAQVKRVKWACINAVEVLEGNDDKTAGRDWAGRWIPIVPCLGEEFDIGGKVDLRGIVRDSMDASRVYDYQSSALIETMMLASKAAWIMAAGQQEGFEDQWAQANRKRMPYLLYTPTSLSGIPIGPPQRNTYEPAIQATVVGMQQAEAQIMATTGFHEPSLGQQGPQESGRAIMARQRQGEIGSSNYATNLSHAIRFTGEILVDLLPHIYEAPRVVRILGPDDNERTVMFHGTQAPGDPKSLEQEGIAGIYDVSTGRYDVVVSMGVSKDTQRQEEAEMMTAALQANPGLMPIIGDLYFEKLDTPVARKMAERLKKALDPKFQDEQPGGKPDPAQMQQQITAMQQAGQQLQQQLQQAEQYIQSKQAEAQAKNEAESARTQAEIQSKERLEHLKAETDIRIAEIRANSDLIATQAKLDAQQSQARLEAALEAIQKDLEFARTERVAQRTDARADTKDERDRAERDAERAAAAAEPVGAE